MKRFSVLLASVLGIASVSLADSPADDDLAKKLTNPLAAVISVQLKVEYDQRIGPEREGERYLFQVKPIVPITLNEDWMIVSRTNMYLAAQEDIFAGAGKQFGLTDIEESLFLTPMHPKPGGWEWSVGPALNLPTAINDKLGSGKWSVGPTALLLKQQNAWTYGVLVKQIWSVAGDRDRADVNKMDLQPFVNLVRGDFTYGVFFDGIYDWRRDHWTLPINVAVSRLITLGSTRVRVQGGIRYWAEGSEFDPHGWGGRLSFMLIFPKRSR